MQHSKNIIINITGVSNLTTILLISLSCLFARCCRWAFTKNDKRRKLYRFIRAFYTLHGWSLHIYMLAFSFMPFHTKKTVDYKLLILLQMMTRMMWMVTYVTLHFHYTTLCRSNIVNFIYKVLNYKQYVLSVIIIVKYGVGDWWCVCAGVLWPFLPLKLC